MSNEIQEVDPRQYGWMERNEVNIIYFSPEDLKGDYDFPSSVPTKWITKVPFIDENQIILIDNYNFINMNETVENCIYRVGGKPYIKIDYYAYPILMLDKNGSILDLNNFSTVEELREAVTTIIVLMAESQGFLNYSGQLVREKK